MDYIYPAVFKPNDDGSYTVTFPDLPGCISEGKSLSKAMIMAQTALSEWIEYLSETTQALQNASDIKSITVNDNEFVSLINATVRDNRAVKRTVSLPKWMDEKVIEKGLSLSRVLQDALSQRLH
ncbi:MAG: type II toxin-antitoxin system HicB family antitoxin [Oscillospiraceae bacterium]|nr:type II toxin-antitoxin system HicB family antitoxin [Oscillospiraceae bacterium]